MVILPISLIAFAFGQTIRFPGEDFHTGSLFVKHMTKTWRYLRTIFLYDAGGIIKSGTSACKATP